MKKADVKMIAMKGLASVLLALGMTTGAAWAHQHQAPSGMQQGCQTPSAACSPTVTVALDNKGQLWRTFVNGQTLYVQQRLATGGFAPALPVNAVPEAISTHGESRLQLAFGKANRIYLVWVTKGEEHDSHIRFAYSADAGKHFSKPVTIEQDRHAAMHNFPALAANAQGQVFIAWLDMRDTAIAKAAGKPADHGVTAAVFYNWSDDGGVHFQPQDLRIKSRACLCCHLAMTLDDKGLPELLFRDVYPGSERDHSLVTFAAKNKPLAPVRISFGHWQLQGCPEKGPALWQQGKRLHLLWFDRNQLFYRHEDAGKLSQVLPVGKSGSARGSMAAADGVLLMAWQRYSDGAMRVYVQRSRDGGEHFTKPEEVAATQGASDYPQLVGNDKQVWLSWLTADQGHRLIQLTQEAP